VKSVSASTTRAPRSSSGEASIMVAMPPIAVLAGGLGTRLHPITETIPKSLVEVAGQPFVSHQLELFARRGIRDVVFCIGFLGEQLEDFVGDGARFGVSVRYSRDGDRLLGTGGAVRHALPMLGEEFLVTYGDSYLDIPYTEMVQAFRAAGAAALMTVYRNDNRWDTSNVEYVDGRVIAYDKTSRTSRMRHIDYGLLAMTPAAFSGWENRDTFDLSALLGPLAASDKLAGYETTTRFFETGSHSGIADLTAHLTALDNKS
jgi:N-acetyl-alpha-D-muramate 1-phosphate uridylyltransferase